MEEQPSQVKGEVARERPRLADWRRDLDRLNLSRPVRSPERPARDVRVPRVVEQRRQPHQRERDETRDHLARPRSVGRIDDDPERGGKQDDCGEHALYEQRGDEAERDCGAPDPGIADPREPDQAHQQTDQHGVLVVVANPKHEGERHELQQHERRASRLPGREPGEQVRREQERSQSDRHAEDVRRLVRGNAQPCGRRWNQEQARRVLEKISGQRVVGRRVPTTRGRPIGRPAASKASRKWSRSGPSPHRRS